MDTFAEIIWATSTERVTITPDHHPSSPRENDNLGTIATSDDAEFLGDRTWVADDAVYLLDTEDFATTATALIEKHGATTIIPLREYHDNNGTTLVEVEHPDGPRITALIFDTAESRRKIGTPVELIREVLLAEVQEYNSYATGDVWIAQHEELVTWQRTDQPEITRQDWEVKDAVGGLIGHDWAMTAAADEFPQPNT